MTPMCTIFMENGQNFFFLIVQNHELKTFVEVPQIYPSVLVYVYTCVSTYLWA